MSIHSDPEGGIRGEVDNGQRHLVAFPFFSGMAGVRARDEFLDVAYFGGKPVGDLPIEGTVDGKPARVIAHKPSDVTRAMFVLTVEMIGARS